MRSILCFFTFFALIWNHAVHAEVAETSYTGLLCTKADTAPEKVLGVLVLTKTGEKNTSKIPPLLLVADGAVGTALSDLLDKQATIVVSGHSEGEFFRVTSFKTLSYAKDTANTGDKKEEGKDEAKSGEEDNGKKKKKHDGKEGAKDPAKRKKKEQGDKEPGKKDEPTPGSVIVVPQ